MKKTLLVLTAFFLSLSAAQIALGDELKKEVLTKHMSGEVSAISSNFLALMYNVDMKAQTSYEMTFKIDKNVKLEGRNSLSEIGQGDTVSIVYDETTETDNQGKQRTVECLVKRLIFVKQGLNQFQEPEPKQASPDISQADSDESGAPEKKEDLWDLIKK